MSVTQFLAVALLFGTLAISPMAKVAHASPDSLPALVESVREAEAVLNASAEALAQRRKAAIDEFERLKTAVDGDVSAAIAGQRQALFEASIATLTAADNALALLAGTKSFAMERVETVAEADLLEQDRAALTKAWQAVIDDLGSQISTLEAERLAIRAFQDALGKHARAAEEYVILGDDRTALKHAIAFAAERSVDAVRQN